MIAFFKSLLKKSPVALTKNHRYDKQTKKIIQQLPPDSNCIDIGCFKGEILDLMLQSAPEGHHFGIEPIPVLFKKLEEKYSANTHCTILNCAASNTSGQADFNYVITNPSYSGLLKRDYDKAHEEDTSIRVQTERLDTLIPSDIRIDLIKIDVEGAELRVLEGASRIIEKDHPVVIFEHGVGASEYYGSSPAKLFDFFQSRSMKISNLGAFLKSAPPLSLEAFDRQYRNKENFYFVAHT